MVFRRVLALFYFVFFLSSFTLFAHHPSKHRSKDEELTDAIFPRTDPKVIGQLYQMLKVLDQLFTKHNIPYWIDGGTALGALRHQGIIPWDDDADIVYFIEDQERILALSDEFAAYGFHLSQCEILRLFPSKTKKYPYIDMSGYTLCEDQTYRFASKPLRIFYHPFFWLPQEISPLTRVPFGPLMLNAPNDLYRYVFAGYGADCLTHATYQTHHGGKKQIIRKKVRIVHFEPPSYTIANSAIPLDEP